MTVEEFLDLPVTTAALIAWELANDWGARIGAFVGGLDFPMAQTDVWQMMQAAAVVNMGAKEDERVLPRLPFSDYSPQPLVDVSQEERDELQALLKKYSAIPDHQDLPDEE